MNAISKFKVARVNEAVSAVSLRSAGISVGSRVKEIDAISRGEARHFGDDRFVSSVMKLERRLAQQWR